MSQQRAGLESSPPPARGNSRFEDQLDPETIAELEAAENEAPDAGEFGLHVAAPLGDLAIRAADLGVRYNLNFTKKTKLHTTFANLLDPRKRNRGHFWALRHVDLEVKRGEAVGIIGPNGSGKSTILLALAGILQPSEGVVEVNGHVSTLLSLQAGFDAELTGRENIALAGALMGIDHRMMAEITPGIIKFASIGAFINAPMKTYSSGMRARVGFAIATAVDPDILLLDEVLGTGDNAFKQKSKKRIAEVLHSAKAVVMVTHDLSWIRAFCTRAILLDKGQIVADGSPREITQLHEQGENKRKKNKRKAKQLVKHGKLEIGELKAAIKDGKLDQVVEANQEELVELEAARVARRAKRRAAQASADGAATDGAATDGAATAPAPTGEAVAVETAARPAERPES